jgi:hypothetical protein
MDNGLPEATVPTEEVLNEAPRGVFENRSIYQITNFFRIYRNLLIEAILIIGSLQRC